MKIEWLITNVIAVGPPDRGERGILGMILGVLWSIQGTDRVECAILGMILRFINQFMPFLWPGSQFVM